MDTLLRRRAMISQSRSVMVPYIRGGDVGSYIDTGITPDNSTKVIVWARNLNPSSFMYLFGARESVSSQLFYVATPASASFGKIRTGFGSHTIDSSEVLQYLSGYHKYELNGKTLSVDDVELATVSDTSTLSTSKTIYIFGINNNGSFMGNGGMPLDISRVEIYKSGVLVRELTPVNSPSVGFYDSVSQAMFTNAGNGSLTYGEFNKNAYTQLEYIVCDGAQCFDSGIKGGTLGIVAKFRPTGTTAKDRVLLGARTTSSSSRCEFFVGDSTTANKVFYFCYQTQAKTVYNSASKTNKDLVWIKSSNTATLYESGTQLGTVTGATGSFETEYTIGIGALNIAGTVGALKFEGRIYYIRIGSYRNYIPAKVNGVVGMYDTFNDVFYQSSTSTPFIAGPEI